MPITPDTKDWTWVLERPCVECGFDAARVSRAQLADAVAECAVAWDEILHDASVRERTRDDRWSPLEYGCHVRDVYSIFDGRVEAMLATDNPEFANWDQDEAAEIGDYVSQDPLTVARQLRDAAQRYAERLSGLDDGQWSRPGQRSNGSIFIVQSLAVYGLHDLFHHLWDVRGDTSGVVALR